MGLGFLRFNSRSPVPRGREPLLRSEEVVYVVGGEIVSTAPRHEAKAEREGLALPCFCKPYEDQGFASNSFFRPKLRQSSWSAMCSVIRGYGGGQQGQIRDKPNLEIGLAKSEENSNGRGWFGTNPIYWRRRQDARRFRRRSFLDPPLTPRNGRTLRILAICRISTIQQDEESLADQEALYRQWLADHVEHPFEMMVLASQGSGESLDRADYLEAIERVEKGDIDLVITEDVGRICRRVHAVIFAELCEDTQTRLIALNDHIDTGRDDWRVHSGFAVMRHEMYNRDTAARIRRSHRNRFEQGGLVQFTVYGYVKPPGAKFEHELSKDPAAEPIYREWFERLERGATYAEIADWLNDQGIPVGPLSRSKKWTHSMVGRVTHNPILKGLRVRGAKMNRRINKTGRRHAVKAPVEDRLERHCPHLAFFDADYYDRVIRLVDARNAHFRRKGKNGRDSRVGVARKRTTWPGQHMKCGVCGRLYYWSGTDCRKLMKCSGSHEYRCWNAVEVNGALIQRKLSQAILQEVMRLPDFDEAILRKVRDEWRAMHAQAGRKGEELAREIEAKDRQINKVTDAIADVGLSDALRAKLRTLEDQKSRLRIQLDQVELTMSPEPSLPTLDAIKQEVEEMFSTFVPDDPETSRLMHRLVPELKVLPYQLCDGGNIVLRAHFVLHLAALADTGSNTELPVLQRPMVVDLFEPPQRARFRTEVMALRASGLTERQVAAQLGITQPAAQNAAALQREMDRRGLTDPYVLLTEPPDSGHARRHRHPRYRFEPLDPDSSAE